ncbi:MAG: FmdB family transcriptional regulator [Spirochaetaceae bacterium]|jgi:putative FmdB family regulatory protein|nr:FmdB family transcriptional regulator [Spirochaetaceae bacterium]
MPTYEYECKKCAHAFELFQNMSDEPARVCPKCGGEVRRLINGGAGVIYKGAGFYSTDKAAPSAAKKSSGGKPDAASPCASCPHSDGASTCPEKAAG